MTSEISYSAPLQAWLDWIGASVGHDAGGDHSVEALKAFLADDVVFLSPVVFTPQKGRDITAAYLTSAGAVLHDGFHYVSIIEQNGRAALEFECQIDGKYVNGVDLIDFDEDGKISQFKVMIRPLQAIQAIHAKMAEQLEKLKSA